MLSANAELPTGPARHPKAVSRIEHFPRGAASRLELEAFIADSFRASYGAEVSHFSEVLLGVRDKDGHWIAALGYTQIGRASCRERVL